MPDDKETKPYKDRLADLLEEINIDMAKTLAKRVRDSDCDAATLGVARQFLKDNMVSSTPNANPHLKTIGDKLGNVPDPDAPLKFKHG